MWIAGLFFFSQWLFLSHGTTRTPKEFKNYFRAELKIEICGGSAFKCLSRNSRQCNDTFSESYSKCEGSIQFEKGSEAVWGKAIGECVVSTMMKLAGKDSGCPSR